MNRRRILLIAGAAVLAGCSDKPAAEPQGKTTAYELRGEIVSVDPARKSATIKHEEIKGWMDAMTMDFPIKPDAEFAKLKPGMKIRAKVYQRESDLAYWVSDVQPE